MKSKTIMLLTLTVLMSFILIGVASACSCIYYETAKEKLENADYVFTGEVVDIQRSGAYAGQQMQETTIRIINHWKPTEFPESVNLEVYAIEDTGANCGYNFEEGQSYLIYAYIDEETGRITTNSCMGNSLLNAATRDINELNNLIPNNDPKPQEPNPNQNEEETNVFSRFFSWIRNLFS